MDLLSAYADDEDEVKQTSDQQENAAAASASTAAASTAAAPASSSSSSTRTTKSSALSSSSSSSLRLMDPAPDVAFDLSTTRYYVDPQAKRVDYNPTVDELYAPLQGPQKPIAGAVGRGGGGGSQALMTMGGAGGLGVGGVRNHQLGFVQPMHMSNYTFESNYNQFLSKGVTVNPAASSGLVAAKSAPADDSSITPAGSHTPDTLIFNSNRTSGQVPRINNRILSEEEKQRIRSKRKAASSDAGDVESWRGPWAPRETEEDEALADPEKQVLTPEQIAERERVRAKKRKQEERKAHAEAAAAGGGGVDDAEAAERAAKSAASQAQYESTIFHGESEVDYQGRTYITPPSTLHVPSEQQQCYIPKRLIHTFTGHTKGVNSIKFFPTTGHLLLSASMDKTMKIWNVVSSAHGGYKCLRTISGHSEAVRGIDFNPDGNKFMSCSYDRYVKLWDTETGQCIQRFSSGKTPYCVRMHPDAEFSNDVLIGQSNNLIVQLDLRSNAIVQTYNEHLSAVNTVTFIDGNKRFVSSSDDKKLLVWEYGIPVVIKHLAEPDMHSMPYVAVHPSGKYFCGQSQDNQILCFTAINKYKLKRDKRFIGHLTAGYACEIGFSPDGSFIMSGDAQGRVLFWDWRSGKVFKKLKCHDQVTIGCQWNPIETSKVATCSWDGTIKYWD